MGMRMNCPECHATLTLNENGELVCSNCGLVISSINFEKLTYKRVLPPRSALDSRSLGSLLLLSYKEKKKMSYVKESSYKRLAKIQLLSSKFNTNSTHYRVLKTLDNVISKLSIPISVRDRAIQIYFKIMKYIPYENRVNHYRVMAASLIYAIKEMSLSIPIRDIIQCFKKLGHRVDYSKLIDILTFIKQLNDNNYNLNVNLSNYVYGIISKCFQYFSQTYDIKFDDSLKMKIYRKSLDLINSLEKRKKLGRNPYIIALSAIYAASIIVLGKTKKNPLSQKVLSKISGFSESAIRNAYRKLFRKYVNG